MYINSYLKAFLYDIIYYNKNCRSKIVLYSLPLTLNNIRVL